MYLKILVLICAAYPLSKLIFLRSPTAEDLKDDFAPPAEACWPFHCEVIQRIKQRIVLCLGKKAGKLS